MAEIVKGLFGIDPQGYQEQRLAQQRAEAMQYSKLDPFQQANTAIYQGVQQGIGAGLNMMGVQDPELQAQQIASQLAPNYDMNDPASLEAFQKALQEQAQKTGNGKLSEFSAMVGSKIMQIKSTGAEIGLKQAQATKALREPNPGIAALIGKSTPESVAAYQQSGNPADLVLAEKGLSNSNKEKVAAAVQANEMIDLGNAELTNYIDIVKNKEVQYGPMTNLTARATAAIGSPSENALKQQEIEAFLTGQINEVLNAAKGVQAKDDALRAERQIKGYMATNSNAGMQKALEVLQKTKERVKKGNEAYVSSLTGEEPTSTKKPTAPTPNTGIYSRVRSNPGWKDASDAEIDAAIKNGTIKVGKVQ
jgi:hypothetical protein